MAIGGIERKGFAPIHSAELGTDLATPGAVFEALVHPRCLLNGRNVLPSLVVARPESMMQCIEDPKLRLPRAFRTCSI
jgi:hypothetical protein